MNRKLIVMRHADTERKAAGQDDHARELTPKGRGDALRVAAGIQAAGWTPQKVVCSDAARTKETWSCMAEVFEETLDVSYTNDLYLAGVDRALEVLYALDDELTEVAILGHNPGWQRLVKWLSGTTIKMAPGTAALLSGAGPSWAEALGQHDWTLDETIKPDPIGFM